MTAPTTLLQRMQANELHEKVRYIGNFADKHLESAIHKMPPSKTVLGGEHIAITLTPYEVSEDDAELYYHIKIVSANGYDSQSFNVLGRCDAQKVFGFLSSQFFY